LGLGIFNENLVRIFFKFGSSIDVELMLRGENKTLSVMGLLSSSASRCLYFEVRLIVMLMNFLLNFMQAINIGVIRWQLKLRHLKIVAAGVFSRQRKERNSLSSNMSTG
jgi:hypothetical protein